MNAMLRTSKAIVVAFLISFGISQNAFSQDFYDINTLNTPSNDAAKFSPERAEYEFYTLAVQTGDLVINEFMADNDNVVADQDGEFDDWIELYNNSNSAITLDGHYLSDDGTDLTQWAFPDTTIDANSYLIIWADNDSDQAGLHTNFALSSSGEAIYLVDADTSIVDEVTFGAQTTDLSTGRYPNGTGDFEEMTPSYAAENTSTTGTDVEDDLSLTPSTYFLAQNYPNPFNPGTTISFELPGSNFTSLKIYNIIGQQIATLIDEQLSAGNYQVQWNAQNLPSGIYFYALKSGSFSKTKRMTLMK